MTRDPGAVISCVIKNNWTYLTEEQLFKIAETCTSIEKKGLPGIFIEAGCALGGSAILIASVKSFDRKLSIFDVFGMIPPPTSDDTEEVHNRYQTIKEGISEGLGDNLYYGYEPNLLQKVQSNFSEMSLDCNRMNVNIVKGLLQQTMQLSEPVAFAHIDVDWYEPVKVSLERIYPKLTRGGSIILDDYFCWGGCRKAVDDFVESISSEVALDPSANSLQIRRI